jgi:hypothetical protein
MAAVLVFMLVFGVVAAAVVVAASKIYMRQVVSEESIAA